MNLLGARNMARAMAPHMSAGAGIISVSTIFSNTFYGRIPYVVPVGAEYWAGLSRWPKGKLLSLPSSWPRVEAMKRICRMVDFGVS